MRQGRNGQVRATATVTTSDVTLCARGEEHYARATAVGELGTNPYHSRTANGTDVSSFQVKVARTRSGREKVDTLDVSAFGERAAACQSYLYRGAAPASRDRCRYRISRARRQAEGKPRRAGVGREVSEMPGQADERGGH